MAIMVGVTLLVAGLLLLFGHNRKGMLLARAALVFNLTVVNLLAYYFNQFAMISSTALSLVALLAIQSYLSRTAEPAPEKVIA